MKTYPPDPHQWELLGQQFRQEVMAEIQRLKATQPKDPTDEAYVHWFKEVHTLRNRLTQLMDRITTMNHTAQILQGKDPYGPTAKAFRRAGDEN
jgi:hypothetical protein